MATDNDVRRAATKAYERGHAAAHREIAERAAAVATTAVEERKSEPLTLEKRFQLAAITVAYGTEAIKSAAESMEWSRDFLATGMKMLDDLLVEVEAVATHPFAQGTEARRAETGNTDSVHDGPVVADDAPDPGSIGSEQAK